MTRRTKSLKQKDYARQQDERQRRLDKAQQLARKLLGGACGQHTKQWLAAEVMHQSATTSADALTAAEDVLQMCAQCPVKDLCQQWAETDEYTGLAAGKAWVEGSPREPSHTRYQPQAAA